MNNDTIKLIRKPQNVNSLMVIIFYMLDIALIRLGDLVVYHIAGKSAYYEDIAQLVSYCIQYLVVVPIVLVVFRLVSGKKEGLKITACFRKSSMPAKWVAKWIVISFGLIYASNYINTFIFSYVQKASGTSLKGVDFTSSGTALGGVTSVLAMSVLAPFFEELMFRGYAFQKCRKVWSAHRHYNGGADIRSLAWKLSADTLCGCYGNVCLLYGCKNRIYLPVSDTSLHHEHYRSNSKRRTWFDRL